MLRSLLIIALATCSGCAERCWTHADTIAEIAFATTLAADGWETRHITHYCAESNPIIGTCGDRVPIGVYFPVMAVAHVAIAAALPHGAWRRGFQMLTLGAEINQTWETYNLGWR